MLAIQEYARIFEKAKRFEYEAVDAFESMHGYAVDRVKLDAAARTLACPLKANPPHWQHGRVVYAAARARLYKDHQGMFLDIGTAKGFSACVMSWAIEDAKSSQSVISIDVVDPMARAVRNSAAEIGGLLTVPEFVHDFRSHEVDITFLSCGSLAWLRHAVDMQKHGVAFAFVDGKHAYEVVSEEISLLRELQVKGDVIVFDDLQIAPVNKAVTDMKGYALMRIEAGPRQYGVAIRR